MEGVSTSNSTAGKLELSFELFQMSCLDWCFRVILEHVPLASLFFCNALLFYILKTFLSSSISAIFG